MLMKRHFTLSILAVVLVCFSLGGSLLASSSPGDIYLALGDSLTTGTEAVWNNDNLPGYPTIIYDELQTFNSDISYHLLGKSGETSTSMLTSGGQLDQAIDYIEQQRSLGKLVSPVTLSIGGNDMMLALQGSVEIDTALTTLQTNLATILDRLTTAMSVGGVLQGDLVIMTYYNPYPNAGPPVYPIDTNLQIARFNQAIIDAATARNIPIAHVYEPFVGNELTYTFADVSQYPNILALDFHPRWAGHEVIADTFLGVLNYQLPSTATPTSTPIAPTATPITPTTTPTMIIPTATETTQPPSVTSTVVTATATNTAETPSVTATQTIPVSPTSTSEVPSVTPIATFDTIIYLTHISKSDSTH